MAAVGGRELPSRRRSPALAAEPRVASHAPKRSTCNSPTPSSPSNSHSGCSPPSAVARARCQERQTPSASGSGTTAARNSVAERGGSAGSFRSRGRSTSTIASRGSAGSAPSPISPPSRQRRAPRSVTASSARCAPPGPSTPREPRSARMPDVSRPVWSSPSLPAHPDLE